MKVNEQLLRTGNRGPSKQEQKGDIHGECIVYRCEEYNIVQNREVLINIVNNNKAVLHTSTVNLQGKKD